MPSITGAGFKPAPLKRPVNYSLRDAFLPSLLSRVLHPPKRRETHVSARDSFSLSDIVLQFLLNSGALERRATGEQKIIRAGRQRRLRSEHPRVLQRRRPATCSEIPNGWRSARNGASKALRASAPGNARLKASPGREKDKRLRGVPDREKVLWPPEHYHRDRAGERTQEKNMLLQNIHRKLSVTSTDASRLIVAASDRALQLCVSGDRRFRDRPRSACPQRPAASPASLPAPAPASLRLFLHPRSGENRRGTPWDAPSTSTRALWATQCHQAPGQDASLGCLVSLPRAAARALAPSPFPPAKKGWSSAKPGPS